MLLYDYREQEQHAHLADLIKQSIYPSQASHYPSHYPSQYPPTSDPNPLHIKSHNMRQGSPDRVSSHQPTYSTPKQFQQQQQHDNNAGNVKFSSLGHTPQQQLGPTHSNGQMPNSGAGLTQGMWSPQGYTNTNTTYMRGIQQSSQAQQQYDMYADDRVDEEHKTHSYPPPPPLYNTPYTTHPTHPESSLYHTHTHTHASPLTQHPAALLASITHSSPYSPPYTPRDTSLTGEQSTHPLSATGTANDFYWLKQYQLNHALHSSHSSSSGKHHTTSFSTSLLSSSNQHNIPDLTSTYIFSLPLPPPHQR